MNKRADSAAAIPPAARPTLGATNVPNILTYARIAAVPALVACFFLLRGDWAHWLALTIFVAAGLTDILDGYVARAWKQQSLLGRMLDPIADKLLVSTAVLMLVSEGIIGGWSIWAAVVILCREILVSGLREFLAELNVGVPVTRLAKSKTAMQMVAIGILLTGPAGEKVVPGVLTIGLGCLWISAILTLYTGYDYFRAGIGHLIDEA
jgi:CDP-diacylglycerol---glycerol-3-phosphate 3-phosphatidyltransferase